MDDLRTIRRLATLTTALLAATIVYDLVIVAFDVIELSLLQDALNGVRVPVDELRASDERQAAGSTAGIVLLVATAIAFVAWFGTLAEHVARTGARPLRHRPGWALAAWLVPGLNLVRPRQIADDLWAVEPRGAAPLDDAAHDSARRAISRWWSLWVVSTVGGIALARLSTLAETVDGLRTNATIHLVILLVDLAAAGYAIRVVRLLTRRRLDPVAAPHAQAADLAV